MRFVKLKDTLTNAPPVPTQPLENIRKNNIKKDIYSKKMLKIVCIIDDCINMQIEASYPFQTIERIPMSKKKIWQPEKSERAMIEGIIEGSPDAIGVAVIRLDCGCKKMAAVDKNGEPASKIIMYRDMAEAICAQCQKDNGDFMRVTEQFISWAAPEPDDETKRIIAAKVLGTQDQTTN